MTTTETLPTLDIRPPLCPVCLAETSAEDADSFHCTDCGIEWDAGGENPTWIEAYFGPASGQCRSTLTRDRGGLSLETEALRCMRGIDHESPEHCHPDLLFGWKNGDPGVSEVAE